MISNCDGKAVSDRNFWIEGLMEAGLEIDHYGGCTKWKNKEEDLSLGKDWHGMIVFTSSPKTETKQYQNLFNNLKVRVPT